MKQFILQIYLRFKFVKRGLKVNPFSILTRLEESQYWERSRIEKEQLEGINNLVEQSIRDVKYYQHNKYRGIQSFKSIYLFWKNFPILTKENIRNNSESLINEHVNKRIGHSTSGSTGEYVTVEIAPLAETYRLANFFRFYRWWGTNFYDKNVYIWRIPERKNKIYSSFKKLEYRLLGKLEVDVFDLNDNTILSYFDKIESFNPKYIRGYKSGVFELARLMDRHNLRFKKTQLKVIVVTAETLVDKERDYIEKILGSKVANEYGSADGGQYAFECPHGSLHINEESVCIAVDESNNTLVTEIFNNGMPLINYENGDNVILTDVLCECGRKLKVMSKIEGRKSDYIQCKDGTKVTSTILGLIFCSVEEKYEESIIQFNVIQTHDKLQILIIPSETFSDEVSQYLESLIYLKICKDLEVEIKLVEQIKRDASGKSPYYRRIKKSYSNNES